MRSSEFDLRAKHDVRSIIYESCQAPQAPQALEPGHMRPWSCVSCTRPDASPSSHSLHFARRPPDLVY